ncbi:MAG TPA: hypothetical protein VK837_07460 [Longimicrobiales bacterium]|nr:hypothetical protein [Longimicrobiales bacterium]
MLTPTHAGLRARLPRFFRARFTARLTTAIVALVALGATGPASAQDHDHDDGDHGHHGGLHFTHPLIAESVSPDTKVRLDHDYFEFPDGDTEHAGTLEAEYAFTRGFSIELGLPYSYTASALGNLEAVLKFANYAHEDAGLLLGYGIEFGFPTNGNPEEAHEEELTRAPRSVAGHQLSPGRPSFAFTGGGSGVGGTLGTTEYEIAPFLNVGFMRNGLELVGWAFFEIPFNQEEPEEVATELAYNVSTLYPTGGRVQALLELDGSSGISGEAVDEDVVQVSPGLRFRPLPDRPLVVGTAASFPISGDQEIDLRWRASVFWHF